MANAGVRGRPIEPLVLSAQERAYLERQVRRHRVYLSPPNRALVLSIDEKSQIQALDREQPVFSMMPGVPERRTHSYVRHGTTTLFAALERGLSSANATSAIGQSSS